MFGLKKHTAKAASTEPIAVRIPCKRHGIHVIPAPMLALTQAGATPADAARAAGLYQAFIDADPEGAELIEHVAEAGFSPDDQFMLALDLFPMAYVRKRADGVFEVIGREAGPLKGMRKTMTPPQPPEEWKRINAQQFAKLQTEVQFTVLKRLVERGFTMEDWGLDKVVATA